MAPIISAVVHLNVATFAAAEIILAAALTVASIRWSVLLAGQRCNCSVARLLRLNFIASFYNVVLPGQESGNAVKAVLLGQSSGQASRIWASVLVDQLTLFIALLLTGLAGLLTAPGFPGRPDWLGILIGLLLGICVLTAFFVSGVMEGPIRSLSLRVRWGRSKREWLYPFWAGLTSYRYAVGHLLIALVLAIVYQLVVDASIFTLANGLGLAVSFPHLIWVLAAVYIAQSLPFTVAGLGVRDATLVFFLAPLGVAAGSAIALSFTIVVLYLVFALPGALLQFAGDVRRDG